MRWMALVSSSFTTNPLAPFFILGVRLGVDRGTHLSTSNTQLDFTLMRTNKCLKLLNHTLQQSQPVVFSKSSQEVFQNFVLVRARTGNGLQFLDDLLLVAHGQGGRVEDGGEFGVLFEDFAELGEGFGD
jgi:hypothetical protein